MSKKLSKESLGKAADWTSRKYRTAWYLTLLFTLLMVIPAFATLVFALVGEAITFTLMPVAYYVPFITVIWSAYFGANVMEKRFFGRKPDIDMDYYPDIDVEDYGDQPEDSNNP